MTNDSAARVLDVLRGPILIRKRLGANKYLVVVDSSPGMGCENLLNKEAFPTNGFDEIIWQINVAPAEQRKHNPNNSDGWSFVGLVEQLGITYAQRWDGGLFSMNSLTGEAVLAAWIK